jgi:hypothetical protein
VTPYDGNFRKRLTKLVKALVLVAATSTMVSGKSAYAQNTCWFGAPDPQILIPRCSDTTPFAFDRIDDKNLTITKHPTIGYGTISFTSTIDPGNPTVYNIDVTFGNFFPPEPGVVPTDFPSSIPGLFEYDLGIFPSGMTYDSGALSSTMSSSAGNEVVSTRVTKNVINDSDFQLVSENGARVFGAFTIRDLTSIKVKDEYIVYLGSLKNFRNSFTQLGGSPPDDQPVPGPLPVLGAAAAYGYSRRLRGRIGVRRPV